MKKKLEKSDVKRTCCVLLFLGLANTGLVFADDSTYGFSQLGYGTFQLDLTKTGTPITDISFDYGYGNFTLQDWGAVSTQNATLSVKTGNFGVYHYEITAKDTTAGLGIKTSLTQMPFMDASSVPVKNMPFAQYYGLPQNIQINGVSARFNGACNGSICDDPAPGKVLGGYYADWTIYAGHSNYSADQLPFGYFNTLYYGFGSINPVEGDAEMLDPNADALNSQLKVLPYLAIQGLKYPYLHLMYSFGGWGSITNNNFQSGDLSVLFTDYPEKIQSVADSMVGAMLRTGFNGIDIDYEWTAPFESDPQRLGGHHPLCLTDGNYCVTAPLSQAEADGYAELIYDLRTDLNSLPNATLYKLSNALFAGSDKIQALAKFTYNGNNPALQGQNDLKIILNAVSHVDLMTYDFHGSFDAPAPNTPATVNNVSDFQSQFGEDPAHPGTYDVKDAVNTIENAGALAKNIVVGVPAYGRIVRLGTQPTNPTPEQSEGIYDPLADSSEQANVNTDVSGEFDGDDINQYATGGGDTLVGSAVFNYRCIIDNHCNYAGNQGSHPLPTDLTLFGMTALPNTNNPGNFAQTPWGYGAQTHTFLSFDNQLSAANKANYVVQNGLAGVMVWELDGDVQSSDPDFKDKSLMYAMYSVMHANPTGRD